MKKKNESRQYTAGHTFRPAHKYGRAATARLIPKCFADEPSPTLRRLRYHRRCQYRHTMSAPSTPVAVAVRFGWLCAAVALVGRPSTAGTAATGPVSSPPTVVAGVASRCAGVPDTVDCLLRAAAAGVDALARSEEPVRLVPGCVTLVKNTEPAVGREFTPPSPFASAADALVDSVAAFAESRSINVRAPSSVLHALKHTLTEGNEHLWDFSRIVLNACT